MAKTTTPPTKTQKMAAAAKKNAAKKPAAKAAPKSKVSSFEVTITINKAFSAMTKGIVYGAQTIVSIATARDEQSAVNKSLRSFGLLARRDVDYNVASRPVGTPNVAAYNPSK